MATLKDSTNVIVMSSISATLGTIITQPLDVLKTRLQAPPILSMQSSVGVLRTTVNLWSHAPPHNRLIHRIRLFWAGTIPSLWRSVPGVCAYFTTINLLNPHITGHAYPELDAFILGFASRSLVESILMPFTVVKAQAEAGILKGDSTFSSLRWIFVNTKWRGIFSGLWPTLIRDSPYSGIYLLFYTHFKKFIIPVEADHTMAPVHILGACASLAALCATAVTQPADVLRSNRQLSIATAAYDRRIPWTRVIRDTIRVDGITGLWRGFYLRLARRGVFAVITWTLFDKIPTTL